MWKMSYLVCYKCDVYYEVETEEEVRELTHCECGEKLIYFENLEDSYNDVNQESLYEALNEVPMEHILIWKKPVVNIKHQVMWVISMCGRSYPVEQPSPRKRHLNIKKFSKMEKY